MQNERYSRQASVPEFTKGGQQRLQDSHVVIIGAGGLGCVAAPLLVGAGVGEITIVDHDVVSLSNLHRQVVYREGDIGKPKAMIMAAALRALNSNVKVNHHVGRCTPANVETLIQTADLVIDAADNFVLSYLLSDGCLRQQKVLVAASVNRTYGYVGAFCGPAHDRLPTFQAVFPKVPSVPVGCDDVGVLGPSVAAIGAVQAQEALKYLLRHPPKARLWQFELWDYSVHCIDVSNALDALIEPVRFLTSNNVTDQWVIDVRERCEVQEAPLPFSSILHYPLSELTPTTPIDRSKPWVFACKSGQRALAAAQRMYVKGQDIAVLLPTE